MFSESYKRYVLGTLTFVYMLSILDSNVMSLLLQPIKDDLHLSDSQLGFVTGIAFGLFYATLPVPIAIWSDRGNRVTISSIAIGVWGITVMACLFVGNFFQLVLARMAASVGEAGGMPPTYSLVGDYFPDAKERSRAMAVYLIGGPISTLVSFALGGWLNALYGWRVAFFLMGAPGLLAAILIKLTVAEPRHHPDTTHVKDAPHPRLMDVMRYLWREPTCRHLIIAFVVLYLMGNGLSPWYAAFMIRSHGMDTISLGIWLGLILGLGGIAGILLGSEITARWLSDDASRQLRLCALSLVGLVPLFALFLLLPGKYEALFALTPLIIVYSICNAPVFALLQRIVTDDIRATTLAIMMLLGNLIGMGVGPQIVGGLSDALRPSLGQDSLRYAMLLMSLMALWSAGHLWRAATTVNAHLAAVPQPSMSASPAPTLVTADNPASSSCV